MLQVQYRHEQTPTTEPPRCDGLVFMGRPRLICHLVEAVPKLSARSEVLQPGNSMEFCFFGLGFQGAAGWKRHRLG